MNPRTRAWLLSDEGAKTRQWGKASLFDERCWEKWTSPHRSSTGSLTCTAHKK